MKKKLVITLLLAALATTSLAGCGKKETVNVPDEGTEVVAEIDTETEAEEVIVAETETEEDTESAELVYNTETEEVTDKTTEKTDAKKDTTGTGSTKGSSSTSTSTSGVSAETKSNTQSSSAGTSGTSGSTSISTNNSASGSTGTTGNETKPNTETSGTQNNAPSTSETQTPVTETPVAETPSEPETPAVEEEKNYCPYPVWQVMDLGDGYVGYYCPDDVGTDPNYIQNWGSCEDELRSGKWGKVESVSDYPRFGPYDDDFRYVTLYRMKKVEE